MMKVIALTKYSYEGPSSRYRFYNYKACFAKEDIEMTISPLFNKSYFTANHKVHKLLIALIAYLKRFVLLLKLLVMKNSYDLLLIEYELFPYTPAWFEYLLHKRGIRYIVDYDDAIFHKYDMSTNKIIYKLLYDKISKVMAYAEHVVVCNAYLEAYAKKYNTHTCILPTVVQLEKYKKEMETFVKKDEDLFIIGWIGSRTTSVYILDILPAMERFIKQHENVRFDLVGFDASLLSPDKIGKYCLNIIPWSEEKEIACILNFDVGIMPLHDDAWSKGKCGFKLVQYMSCKKPVIASPVGINSVLVSEGVNGCLARGLDDWFEAFETLYLDKALKKQMSKSNFEKIEKEYNHKITCEKYMVLINNILTNVNEGGK